MKFEFSVDEINIILQGLAELPAKHSMNIIARIQEDAAKQMQPEMKPEEGAEQPLFYCGQTSTVPPIPPTPIMLGLAAFTQFTPGTQI